MNATVEILSIGREILDGRVVDTNAVEIAQSLRPLGLTPRFAQRVDDQMERVQEAFAIAASRSTIIIVTGGLGPTSDDLTAEAFARFSKKPLKMNEEALGQVQAVFERLKTPMLDVQKKQALLPEGSTILVNREGTAPGFYVQHGNGHWFFMPGVPREMRRMLRDEVLPRLPRTGNPRSKTWSTQFTSEGKLQQSLGDIESRLPPGFEISYRTHYPENHVALYADNVDSEQTAAFEALCHEMDVTLGPISFTTTMDGNSIKSLEEIVLEELKSRGLWLATVESCTGGLIAHRITGIPGSSEAFWGGFVTYHNRAKETVLGLPSEILAQHGAVSQETARAMAELGLRKMRESLPPESLCVCVSTTGIAGPGGGTPQKPVGLCFVGLACSTSNALTQVEEVRARPGLQRDQYKTLFAQKALDLVRKLLLSLQ